MQDKTGLRAHAAKGKGHSNTLLFFLKKVGCIKKKIKKQQIKVLYKQKNAGDGAHNTQESKNYTNEKPRSITKQALLIDRNIQLDDSYEKTELQEKTIIHYYYTIN